MPELETGVTSAPEAAVVANSTPEVTSTPDDTMAAVFDKFHPEERVGRENGKFVSKNPAEGAVTAEPAKEINQEPVAEKAETVKADTPAPSIKPRPQSWSADLDDFWKSLPP